MTNGSNSDSVLRLMTGPDGEWPRPAPLGGRVAIIHYSDFHSRMREWAVALVQARQSDETILLDCNLLQESRTLTLRLRRVTAIECDGVRYTGLDFLTRICGLEIKRTTGPRSAKPMIGRAAGASVDGPLAGQKVAVTGELDQISRASIRQVIAEAGGVMTGIIEDASMLVLGGSETVSPSLVRKASRLNLRQLTEAEFVTLVFPSGRR